MVAAFVSVAHAAQGRTDMKQPCVYLLASRPRGALYIGVTSDLRQRLEAHRSGEVDGFTRSYGIRALVWYELHDEMESAIRDWLLGESCRLLDFLSVRIEYNDSPHSPFRTRFLEDRLHHLKTFYDRALTRYRDLRGETQHIAQDELDDLVVKAAF